MERKGKERRKGIETSFVHFMPDALNEDLTDKL
jgi:hypothetical protein